MDTINKVFDNIVTKPLSEYALDELQETIEDTFERYNSTLASSPIKGNIVLNHRYSILVDHYNNRIGSKIYNKNL